MARFFAVFRILALLSSCGSGALVRHGITLRSSSDYLQFKMRLELESCLRTGHVSNAPQSPNQDLIQESKGDSIGLVQTWIGFVLPDDIPVPFDWVDQTSVVFGSNLGNANSHDWRALPIVLVGGGFSHGSDRAFDEKNNLPLSNLSLTLLQKQGYEVESFGSSTAPLELSLRLRHRGLLFLHN